MEGKGSDVEALRRNLEQSLERCLFVLRNSSGGLTLVRALVRVALAVRAFGGERFALLFLDETSNNIIRVPGDRYCHHRKRYPTGKHLISPDECALCAPPEGTPPNAYDGAL